MLDEAPESETGERDLQAGFPVCRIRRRITRGFWTKYFPTQERADNWLARHPGDLKGKCDDSCAIICNDNNKCTIDFDGTCEANGCSSVPRKVISCNSNSLCSVGSCDANLGCQYKQKDCSDGDLCTIDKCKERTGKCVNKPIKCNDGNLCTTDTCNKNTGLCEYKADDNKCKSSDPCKIGTCDKFGGCTFTDLKCVSSDPCTIGTCKGGTCEYTPKCVSSDPCQIGRCKKNGKCEYEPKCDDGKLCTVDTCDASGKCTNTQKECRDGNRCTDNTCNEKTGVCDYDPITCPPGLTCFPRRGCQ